jgi:hypothetical protein
MEVDISYEESQIKIRSQTNFEDVGDMDEDGFCVI